jgi:4-hydroxybenzoate polyprenyltransferase
LLVVFGVNDVYDYESDRRNPRKIANNLEGDVLDPAHHSDVLNAAYFSTIFIISSALVNYRRDNILATILVVLLGWQYSSPPLRLKEVPVLDSLSNGATVFLVWFCGFSFSGLSISEVPSSGIMLTLCAVGTHALAAVVDSEADFAVGHTTIATAFGKRATAIFAASC